MRIIEQHIEFLLRKHDCVVIPGWGALLCRYVGARYAADGHTMLPPGRELAFNALLADSDGLLIASVARREGVAFEVAATMVQTEVEQMAVTLREEGELQLGRMGRFVKGAQGETVFEPAFLAGVNGSFYGLRPMTLPLIDAAEAQVVAVGGEAAEAANVAAKLPAEGLHRGPKGVRRGSINRLADGERSQGRRSRMSRLRAYASGAVATIAVLVTLLLFVASPIKLDRPTDLASIAPIPSAKKAPAAQVEVLPKAIETVEVTPIETAAEAAPATEAPEITEVAAAAKPAAVAAKPEATESHAAAEPAKAAPKAQELRFNDNDPYLVVVASFPTAEQAREYISAKSKRRQLEMQLMDGKYRVYASTASNYAAAGSIKNGLGEKDAWVCHR